MKSTSFQMSIGFRISGNVAASTEKSRVRNDAETMHGNDEQIENRSSQSWRQNPWRREGTSEPVAAIAATGELVRSAVRPGILGGPGPNMGLETPSGTLDIIVVKRSS